LIVTTGINRASIVGLLSLTITAISAQTRTAPAIFNPPKSYYLALGDSITYGYQAWKQRAGLPPSGYNTGYVDVFSARLRQIRPRIITVNYGCPGESTDSFLEGSCLWTALGHELHDPFSGTQMQAAVAFLRAHPGEVSPITLNLWGNDLPKLLGPCTLNGQIDLTCIRTRAPAVISQVASNVSRILAELRSVAPNAEIIVTGAWDSFVDTLAIADPVFEAFNAAMADAAALSRARFADPFPKFNPQGDQAGEVQSICTLTLLCTAGDSHPSDAGYRALADVVFDASQYNRLLE